MRLFLIMMILSFTAVVVIAKSEIEENMKKNACASHSCHPLTKCMPMRKKVISGSGYEYQPVCMKVPTCASTKCKPLEKCVMTKIKCQLSPCLEVPTCLPSVNEASPEYQMPPAYLV